MSEKMAGIFAINVVNEKDYMEINGKRIERKEYNGVPILTSWDIAEIHGKETKRINEQFKRNYKRFEEGADYYSLSKENILSFVENYFIPNNVEKIPLFTANGYAKLVKTFIFENNYKIIEETYKFLGGKENINLYLPQRNSELVFKELLEQALQEFKISFEHQYQIGKYRVDFFIPEYNLAIEYDESYHELKIEEDNKREKEIVKISGCNFIRCSYKDNNIKNIIKILKKIGVVIG